MAHFVPQGLNQLRPIVLQVSITQITRHTLVTSLDSYSCAWWGEGEEEAFLRRLYNLDRLPSHDERYEDAAGDFRQHRVANDDWAYEWVFSDQRFGLDAGEDDVFLRFLAETLHPEIRSDRREVQLLLDMYNRHLVSRKVEAP